MLVKWTTDPNALACQLGHKLLWARSGAAVTLAVHGSALWTCRKCKPHTHAYIVLLADSATFYAVDDDTFHWLSQINLAKAPVEHVLECLTFPGLEQDL